MNIQTAVRDVPAIRSTATVLAVENVAQAESRSGGVHGNTGSQAALAALRMANLRRRQRGTS